LKTLQSPNHHNARTIHQTQTPPTSRNVATVDPTKGSSYSSGSLKTNLKTIPTELGSTSTTSENQMDNEKEKNHRHVTQECLPTIDTSDVLTPFKIYVYDLPSDFNTDIRRTMTDNSRFSFCYNLDYCGTGEELYQLGNDGLTSESQPKSIISVRNTNQFSLETIIHYKMLNSPYRTLDPDAADVFYIPAYSGLNCLQFNKDSKEFVDKLFNYLKTNQSQYFLSGKPHVLTLSKIQREQGSLNCPILLNPNTHNITFVGIEKEAHPYWSSSDQVKGRSLIVAPYPSYVHFLPNISDTTLYEFDAELTFLNTSKFNFDTPDLPERNVLLFLAAGIRRSNHFRAQLLDQFPIQLSKHYDKYSEELQNKGEPMPEQIMLITSECSEEHRSTTVPWMMKSKYCLQPPGDSPTRKSFYDAILSGCIPILFTNQYHVVYPFDKYINYDDFSYTIDQTLLANKTVLEIVKEIPHEKTETRHKNLRRLAKWFQYSLSNADINDSDDAFTFVLHEIAKNHKLY